MYVSSNRGCLQLLRYVCILNLRFKTLLNRLQLFNINGSFIRNDVIKIVESQSDTTSK